MNLKRLSVWVSTALVLASTLTATAANRIAITSASGAGCGSQVTAHIYIENDVDLFSFNLPLVARSLSGGAFWSGYVTPIPESGRLASSLTGTRLYEGGRIDFTHPDQLAFYYESASGTDCLPAGPLELMLGLEFQMNNNPGQIEIDTMAYAPFLTVEMLDCATQNPVVLDEFTPGVITHLGYTCPINVQWSENAITAWAGATIQNTLSGIHPSGAPMGSHLVSGPGSIADPSAPWTWDTSPSDAGTYVVMGALYDLDCEPNSCDALAQPFTIELRELVPGDLNCDGQVTVLDVVLEVDHAFRNAPAPVPCWEL